MSTVHTARSIGVRVSPDGYIRLHADEFGRIELRHLISGLDDTGYPLADDADPAAVAGYTEWIGGGEPAISLGWDWELLRLASSRSCRRLGELRSNVMLLDDDERDIGPVWTARLLGATVDRLDWAVPVLRAIDLRWS